MIPFEKLIELPDDWAVIRHKSEGYKDWWAVRHKCLKADQIPRWKEGTSVPPWFGTYYNPNKPWRSKVCTGCHRPMPEEIEGFIALLDWER